MFPGNYKFSRSGGGTDECERCFINRNEWFCKDNDLVLIQKSIQCGYYRSRVTIQHEICEASVSRVLLLLKESFQTGEITQFSCRRIIAEVLIRLNQIDDKSY